MQCVLQISLTLAVQDVEVCQWQQGRSAHNSLTLPVSHRQRDYRQAGGAVLIQTQPSSPLRQIDQAPRSNTLIW